jgi:1,4-dihydroxy-2-naphthoate polyprenyltransferase
MTRPAFLLLTVVACALGTATAAASGGGFDPVLALGTTLLAVTAHAAGNVLNDLHDARSGADAGNTGGIFPFTGGSRLIQDGVVSERETADLARALLWVLVPGGLLLAIKAGGGVIGLGLAGLLLAWAYSAPPLKLMSRGLGELAVALAWFLVVVGADHVQRRQFFVIPASVALNFAALVAALLLINGVPDAPADARVGKRTLAVRLGPTRTAALYAALTLGAHAWLAVSVGLLIPPQEALWGQVSLPLSLFAAGWLWRQRQHPERLRPALAATVAATLLHGLGMAGGFAWLGWRH